MRYFLTVSTNCPNYHRLFFYWMKASRRRSLLLVAAARLSTCQSIVRFKAWRVSPSLPLATIDSFGLDRPSTASIANFACQMEKKAKYKKRVTGTCAKILPEREKVHHFFSYLFLRRSSEGMMMTQTCQPSCAIPQGESRGEELPDHHLHWTSSTSTSSSAWKSLIFTILQRVLA